MKKILLLSCIFFYTSAHSSPVGLWKCYAFDSQHKSFTGIGKTRHASMHDARKNCIRLTQNRHTCKTAQSFCEQGPVSIQDVRCSIVNSNGKVFRATGPTACKTARLLCQEWQYVGKNNYNSNCNLAY